MNEEITVSERDALLKKLDMLREKIVNRNEEFEKDVYDDLSDFYSIKKRLYPSYSFTNLATDVGIPYGTVCKVLGWRYASDKTKKAVQTGKITKGKALFVLQVARENQDKVVGQIISHDLTEEQVKKWIHKKDLNVKNINLGKKIQNADNVARYILSHSNSFKRSLLQARSVPVPRVDECLDALKKHRDLVDKALHVLEKKKPSAKRIIAS